MKKEKQIEIIKDLLEGVIELNGEYQDGWDETIKNGELLLKALRQPDVSGRSAQLTALNEWLDEHHTSFKIPDMILQDYIKYGG